MSNVTTTARAKVVSASNPTIYNLSMPLAATEYSQGLANGTKRILVRMRSKSQSRISFAANGTTTAWVTLEAGAVYFEENLDLNGATIYMQSMEANQTAEILEWV